MIDCPYSGEDMLAEINGKVRDNSEDRANCNRCCGVKASEHKENIHSFF